MNKEQKIEKIEELISELRSSVYISDTDKPLNVIANCFEAFGENSRIVNELSIVFESLTEEI